MMLSAIVASAQIWSNQILTTTDHGAPIFSPNWNYGVGAAIYTASEINLPACELTGIAFKRYSDNLPTSNNQAVEIFLGHINTYSFSNTYSFPDPSQMTKVYDGNFNHPMSGSVWSQVLFDTPFQYDGTSNIIVCIVNKSGSMVTGNDYPYYCTNSSTQQSRLTANSDETPVSLSVANTVSATRGFSSERPVIQFRMTDPAEHYGITVGYTEITENNYTNVTDDELTNGTISFDPTTNTLTLNNITLSESLNAADFQRGDLTVVVQGICEISEEFYCSGFRNTTINGTDNDVLRAKYISVEAMENHPTVTMNNLTVLVGDGNSVEESWSNYSLFGYGDEHIVLNNVELSSWVSTTGECPFDEYLSITLNNCHITYPVGAVVEDGCIRLNGEHDIDSVHIAREIVGLDIVADRDFTLAPNPAIDIVEFQGIAINGNARVSIYNAEGKLVAGVEVSDTDNLRMDVSSLATGIYTVQVIGNRTRYTSKLVKK